MTAVTVLLVTLAVLVIVVLVLLAYLRDARTARSQMRVERDEALRNEQAARREMPVVVLASRAVERDWRAERRNGRMRLEDITIMRGGDEWQL